MSLRLSKFHEMLIISLVTIVVNILFFLFVYINTAFSFEDKATCLVMGMISFLFIGCIVTIVLRKTVGLKYKTIDQGHYKIIKYLTSWFLFIPYWRRIYCDAIHDEDDIIYAINNWKIAMQSEKVKLFKRPDKKITKYY